MSLGFIHLEKYSRRPSAQRKGNARGIRDIIGEMAREPGHCNHVPRPRAARLLHGQDPRRVLAAIEAEAEGSRDRRGFRLREDATVAICFVASYPLPIHDLVADDSELQEYLEWEQAAVAWARGEWGEAFRCAVRHVDEGYSHWHGVLAEPTDAALTPLLHPGTSASTEVYDRWKTRGKGLDRTGEAKKEAWLAAEAALVEFQDDYHIAVGSRFEHGRKGENPQPRLGHSEHVMRYGRLRDRLPPLDLQGLSPMARDFLGEELAGVTQVPVITPRRPRRQAEVEVYTGPVTLLGR